MGDVLGLDYNAVFSIFKAYGIDEDEQWWYLEGIRIFEAELLRSIEKKREKEERKKNAANQSRVNTDILQSKTISGVGRS